MARSRSTPIIVSDDGLTARGVAVARPEAVAPDTDVVYDVLDGPVDFLFKTLRPMPEDPAAELDQGFVQAHMANVQGWHWGRVLEYRPARAGKGVPTGGALVIPYYAGSVQKLVTSQAVLRPRQMHAIVAGTLAGLVELRKAFGRPHGNLKPTNVLFPVAMPTHPRHVALTDPAPSVTARQRGTAHDLLHLGELIHLLVLHRLPRTPEDWAVPPAPQWKRLGRRGRRWRELCQRLVSPRGPEVTLDQAVNFVHRYLRPKRLIARPGVLIPLAAAAVAVALSGGDGYQWLVARQRTLMATLETKSPDTTVTTAASPVPKPEPVVPQADAAQTSKYATPPRPDPEPVVLARAPVTPPLPNVPAEPPTLPPTPPIDVTIGPSEKVIARPAPVKIDPSIAKQWVSGAAGKAESLFGSIASNVSRWNERRASLRRQAALERFIAVCAKPAPTGMTAALAAEWVRANQALADAAKRDPAKLGSDWITQRDRVIARLLKVDRALDGLAKPLPEAVGPTSSAVLAALSPSLVNGDADRIRQLAELASKPGVADDRLDAVLKEVTAAATAQRAEATALVKDVDVVERRLAQGWMLGETLGEGSDRTMASVITGWPKHRAYAVTGVSAALAGLVGAAGKVEQAETPHLFEIALAAEQPLGLRLSAWQRLAKPAGNAAWPATAADLQGDLTLRDALIAAATSLEDRSRAKVIAAAVSQDFSERWGRLLAGRGGTKLLLAALAMQDRVTGVSASTLPPEAKWNASLYALRRLATSPPAKDADVLRRQREAASAVVTAADALPSGISNQKPVADLVGRLRAWTAAPTSIDFSQLGPAAATSGGGGALRWKAEPEAGDDVVAYRVIGADTSARDGSVLYFRRVSSSAGDAYVCTTETPLGLFTDAIGYAGRWNDVRQRGLLGSADGYRHDLRPGPRVWEWSNRRDGAISKAFVWLSNEWLPEGSDHYPDALGAEFNRTTLRAPAGDRADALSPSRRQPMQYLPAGAALYAANLLGCRLPTPQEWKLTYADSPKLRGANLRDEAWRQEYDHLLRSWPRGTYRPDAGAFAPPGEALSNEVWRTPDGDTYKDGALWFREVLPPTGDARQFQDLAGNVAEFVQDAAGAVYVIGASALSPPTRPVDVEVPLDARARERGYSDVGFRLAFPAPQRAVDRLAAVVAGDGGYVVEAK